jgi:hypothetical protein
MRMRMNRKIAGASLVVLGLVVAALSLLADSFSFGVGGFGWKQILGLGLGTAAFLGGAALLFGVGRLHGNGDRVPPRSSDMQS